MATRNQMKDRHEKKGPAIASEEYSEHMGRMEIVSDKPLSMEEIKGWLTFDRTKWRIAKIKSGANQVTMRLRQGTEIIRQGDAVVHTKRNPDIPKKAWNYHWSVELKPLTPGQSLGMELLTALKDKSLVIPPVKRTRTPRRGEPKRAIEFGFPDAHIGMRCYSKSGCGDYSPETAVKLVRECRTRLISEAVDRYGPFEEVLYFFGNDWSHVDNGQGTTTRGTNQPGSDDNLHAYRIAAELAVENVMAMREIAPVKVYVIPGNHDEYTAFTLGMYLSGFFHNTSDVTVYDDPSTYKIWHYGTSLIGGEHGHSLKDPKRLAGLMANETRNKGWADAEFCEWHLADQHRKGSARPAFLEEQGVGVEWLPSVVVSNRWAKGKGFSWQRRGAVAFVYDKEAGPIARLQVNIKPGTNEVL